MGAGKNEGRDIDFDGLLVGPGNFSLRILLHLFNCLISRQHGGGANRFHLESKKVIFLMQEKDRGKGLLMRLWTIDDLEDADKSQRSTGGLET